ncbi:MAG: AAA family ATPase [Kineosporiaceae bacterium]
MTSDPSGGQGPTGPEALTRALVALSRFVADDPDVVLTPADAVVEAAALAAAVAESAPGAPVDWLAAVGDFRVAHLLQGSGRPVSTTVQDFFDAASRGRRWRSSPTAGLERVRADSARAAHDYARALAEVASAACSLGEPTARVIGNASVAAAAQLSVAGSPPGLPYGAPAAGPGATVLPVRGTPDTDPSAWPGLAGLPGVDEIIAKLRGKLPVTGRTGFPERPGQRLGHSPDEGPGGAASQAAPAPPATSPAAGPAVPEPTLEELFAELDGLIGLEKVKREVHRQAQLLRVEKLRTEAGLRTPAMTRHLVFAGNPGTGKTTVARLVGKLYKALGVLPQGQLVEVDRSELVAGYLGQTATKTSEVIAGAVGGVLFIDEAYALAGDQYGQEAIDTLVKEMEDHRDDLVVIVAGYPGRMAEFIATNPGLESRFRTLLIFDDYTDDELVAIFASLASAADFTPTPGCLERLRAMLGLVPRGEGFGNGRYARNLLEGAIGRQAWRLREVAAPTVDQLRELTDADLDEADLDAAPQDAGPQDVTAGAEPPPGGATSFPARPAPTTPDHPHEAPQTGGQE